MIWLATTFFTIFFLVDGKKHTLKTEKGNIFAHVLDDCTFMLPSMKIEVKNCKTGRTGDSQLDA